MWSIGGAKKRKATLFFFKELKKTTECMITGGTGHRGWQNKISIVHLQRHWSRENCYLSCVSPEDNHLSFFSPNLEKHSKSAFGKTNSVQSTSSDEILLTSRLPYIPVKTRAVTWKKYNSGCTVMPFTQQCMSVPAPDGEILAGRSHAVWDVADIVQL